jgi:hypothetical protein
MSEMEARPITCAKCKEIMEKDTVRFPPGNFEVSTMSDLQGVRHIMMGGGQLCKEPNPYLPNKVRR